MIIPYIGGKTKFSKFITPNIPTDISTFVEPFGGMMGVFFSLDYTKYENVKFIYNDLNYLNYNIFKQLKNVKFIENVMSTYVDIELYKESLDGIKSENNDEKLALYWLIVLTCSCPYDIGKYSWRGDTEFEIFKLRYSEYLPKLNRISTIHNSDYKDIIELYDSKSTFFYLDPPYKGKENLYLNHNFRDNSHIELANRLNNIKGRFLLSYYYFDGLLELYPDCKIDSKKTIIGTEYIIMNY